MNYIDLLVLVVLAVFGLLGYKRGLIKEATDFVILLVSFGLALLLFSGFTSFLLSFISLPDTFVRAGAFFAIWFIVELVMYLAVPVVLGRLPEDIVDSRWNHFGGIVLSIVKAAVMIGLVIIALLILPLGKVVETNIKGSFVGGLVDKNTAVVEKIFENTFGDAVSTISKFATVTSDSKERIDLGYTLKNPTSDVPSATRMLILVNEERKKAGLSELTLDKKLSEVAAAHAKDMFARGYLSHYTPEGKSAFDRMKEAGINPFFAGENLALAPDVDSAMAGLMNSTGHRANVLSGDYRKVGIAAYDGGVHGEIFVQEFTD